MLEFPFVGDLGVVAGADTGYAVDDGIGVRRLNTELGMTVSLTTQYLEEADELAGRVGIINKGKLVAAGTPAELKRAIGTDVVIVTLGGSLDEARTALESLETVQRIDISGATLTLSVSDGPSAISPVAGTLANVPGADVRELALRRPSLDDVFLSVTGEHINTGGSNISPDQPQNQPTAESA